LGIGPLCAKIAHMVTSSAEAVEIGPRIALAREELGITQANLARQVGIDRTAVAKIEAGRRKVSAGELVRVAAALDRPIDWFVVDAPPAVVSRRHDPAAGGLSKVLDRTIDRLARDVKFLEGGGVLPSIDVPEIALPESAEDAEEAARRVRDLMGVGSGPVHGLQRACERVGLLAFSLDLGADAGDAAYVAVQQWGVALINGAIDPGRRRFNLAHELGHHVFADAYAPEITISPGSEAERMVNAFAVHVLLPRETVSNIWAAFSDRRLAAVAVGIRCRASWSAVCGQLKNLGLIDEVMRAELSGTPPTASDFVELGERWVSELDPPSTPPEYGRRVLAAYRSGRLSAARTVELLWGEVAEEELPEQHVVPLEGLRREFEPLP
jgi:Zn-dependent peptidase ImmA (M78 family)/transcriptional regulator with XRE-family HTH domain